MISVNKYGQVKPVLEENKVKTTTSQPHDNTSRGDSKTIDASYSQASRSYGVAFLGTSKPKRSTSEIIKDIQDVNNKIDNTQNDELISIEDAIAELKTINHTDSKKCDYILACTFETDNSEVLINKKALYYLKYTLLTKDCVPKLEDAIRTCMDEKTLTFDPEKFESLFNMAGQIKYSAASKLKPRPQNYEKTLREAKLERKLQILKALENNKDASINEDATIKDLFTPLDTIKNTLINQLEAIKSSEESIPEDLYNSLKSALENYDFDAKKIFKDHYSLLENCETIADVKELYPELKFPEVQPKADSSGPRTLRNRLANENFNKVVIDTLKKAYLDLTPRQNIYVEFENSSASNLNSLKKAGFEFGTPSQDLMKFLNECNSTKEKNADFSHLSEDEIKAYANKYAIKKGKIWDDYSKLTKREWRPIRYIKAKRLNPDNEQFNTKKLVNVYLYGLYLKDRHGNYSANPLARYDNTNYLNPYMQGTINKIYHFASKSEDSIKEIGFKEFTEKFDKEAIAQSIEHMEKVYTNYFFNKYWSAERKETLRTELQKAYDIIQEKLILQESTQKAKEVQDTDVEELIEVEPEPDTTELIDERKLKDFKYLITLIKDRELKERCLNCISEDEESDIENFEYMYQLISDSRKYDGSGIDEAKAKVLISVHDAYLNHIMNSSEEITEKEFKAKILGEYKNEDGTYNYEKAINDKKEETKYFELNTKLNQKGEIYFANLVENIFVMNNNLNFAMANKVTEFYLSMPDTFKGKFINVINKNTSSTEALFTELSALHDKISSWNFDKDEIIILDKDRFPQKVVLTAKAKNDLWKMVGENMKDFDTHIQKFFTAATRRAPDENSSGIKTVVGQKFDVEVKIKGSPLRMFPDDNWVITDEECKKYQTDDGIKLKYVFNRCGPHLD